MGKILQAGHIYTFSKLFELKVEVDDLVNEFGYTLQRTELDLPGYVGELDRLQDTHSRISEILPYVNLANEATRREVLIAPVVTDLVHYTQSQLRIEYPIKVSEHLQGCLDYLLRNKAWMIVIEAKQDDLYNGFTQLAIELIALDQWDKTPKSDRLYGAVTTGSVWQFGALNRHTKLIDLLLTNNKVFKYVLKNCSSRTSYADATDIAIASPMGLIILKLYALPSLYRQGQFDRATLYESDITQLLRKYPVTITEVLKPLKPPVLLGSDLEEVQNIFLDIQSRINKERDRFSKFQ